ncbi:dihydropteroate synthase [Candidatus Saccharibacteria bacterium]|nr:dihydropteroate synthase [Candidatus Saccharibacteria bacterium]
MATIRYVGVLNITPDSFSDGGSYNDTEKALARVTELFEQGASIVDIGAESTNPWSSPMAATEEIDRLKPIIPQLITNLPGATFSLDTYHPETLSWVLSQGMLPILNDISGLYDPDMQKLVTTHGLTVVISHLPKDAQGIPVRAHTGQQIDDIDQVVQELLETAEGLEATGIPHTHLILDPGIGFGKTMRLNWQLLDFPAHVPDYDVMLGYSRKRFLHYDKRGKEIPEAVAMKNNSKDSPKAKHAYDLWLAEQHQQILTYIHKVNQASKQTIYPRLHNIPR